LPRPTDPQEQKENYSGKKKSHREKNLILIDEDCIIRHLSDSCPGFVHNKKIED
jgi:hypothetical protein